jgi:hypothetical protein
MTRVWFVMTVVLLGGAAAARAQSAIAGSVIDSAQAAPIRDVEVGLVARGTSTRTDSTGAFVLSVPPGEHRVFFRKLGFRSLEMRFKIANGDTIMRRIILSGAPTNLEKVVVSAGRSAGLPPSFEDNRRVGLGKFFTRDDLEKQGTRRLGDVLNEVSGLGVVSSRGSEGWVISRRMPPTSCRAADSACLASQGIYWPERHQRANGVITACYAQVYVDDVLMTTTRPTEPFNINQFSPDRLEAIEVYVGPSQLPGKYSRLDSRCGVVVLWTRRS